MYDWVTLLYSRNWHHTVYQLYANKKNFFKEFSGMWLVDQALVTKEGHLGHDQRMKPFIKWKKNTTWEDRKF